MTFAAWQHVGARRGFEVVLLDGDRFRGATTAVEDGRAWAVRYEIMLDSTSRTKSAKITSLTTETFLEHDGNGHWQVDDNDAPELDGCLDVDLESSALTNAFPVRRLKLGAGEKAQAPAAYVRATDLRVERMEQQYTCLAPPRYHYAAPRFDFECELVYDDAGLVIDYPGIATRAA